MINFNKPSVTDIEKKYILDSLDSDKLCGDGKYTRLVQSEFQKRFSLKSFLLTTSCSTALDMTAILLDLKKGDEVIMPSFTFVSTANAVVLRGATPIFCDVEKDTMNIDPDKIEDLITPNTKAIYCVHYAGKVCDMDRILAIAKKHNLYVVEDAAQAVGSTYKGRYAGTFGDMACYSFHETKNIVMGEGGALIINNDKFLERAEIIREKGTDRSKFLRGQVDKYTWRDMGTSCLPSDILCALLYGQMERYDEIFSKRMSIWNRYYNALLPYTKSHGIILQQGDTKDATHNAHMFYLLLKDNDERTRFISYLKEHDIQAVFHYIPLDTSPYYKMIGNPNTPLDITEDYSSRLVRLPMYADLQDNEVEYIIDTIKKFFN